MTNIVSHKEEIFKVYKTDIIDDVEENVELNTGYEFEIKDISLPELSFALSQFLKQLDADESVGVNKDGGKYFLHLLIQNYNQTDSE